MVLKWSGVYCLTTAKLKYKPITNDSSFPNTEKEISYIN